MPKEKGSAHLKNARPWADPSNSSNVVAATAQRKQGVAQKSAGKGNNKKGKPEQRKQRNQKNKGKQVDARWAKPATLVVGNSLKVDPINTGIALATISGIPIEYISRAVANGFYTVTEDFNNSFGAANWIYKIIQAAIFGATPLIQSGPLWLVQLCKCIASKQARLGNTIFSYKPTTDAAAGTVLTPRQPIGPPQYNYEYNFSIPGGATPVDGFTVGVDATLPFDEGETAWQSLVQFLQSYNNPQEKSIPFSSPLHNAEKTVSMFGVNFDRRGGGKGGIGGYYSLCGSETPIYQPVLALMGASGQDSNVTPSDRVSYFTRKVAGDSLWMTNVMSTLGFAGWEQDRPTHFHSIDFLEFGTVLATWAAEIVTQFLADLSNVTELNSTVGPASLVCPLTLQEFLLLLRNEMMMIFKRSQAAVQSLYPLSPVNLQDNQFVAFLSSSTTCPINGTGMKLPQSIVENMRSLTERYVFYGQKANQFEWWVPVLGKYVHDELSREDYTYTSNINDTITQIPVFAAEPLVQTKQFNKEGVSVWVTLPELAIDLVDGFCGAASPSGEYLFINSSVRLQQLATIWNAWVVRFDQYSDPLVNAATEGGPLALCSISTTRHWTVPAETTKKRAAAFVDARLQVASLMATPYVARIVVADTFSQEIDAPLYESIQSKWILPTNRFQVGTQPNNRSTLQAYISQFSEGNTKIRSADGEDSVTLSAIHSNLALKMTHSRNAQPNDWIEAFKQASAMSQGGLISGLIAKFAGAAFGDQVGAIASGVANMLPV